MPIFDLFRCSERAYSQAKLPMSLLKMKASELDTWLAKKQKG